MSGSLSGWQLRSASAVEPYLSVAIPLERGSVSTAAGLALWRSRIPLIKSDPQNTSAWFHKTSGSGALLCGDPSGQQVTAVHPAPSDYPSGKAGDASRGVYVLELPARPQRRPAFRTARPSPFRSRRHSGGNRPHTGTRSSVTGAGKRCGWCKDRWGCPGDHPRPSPARWRQSEGGQRAFKR